MAAKTLKELKSEYSMFIQKVPEYLEKLSGWLGRPQLTFDLDEINEVQQFYLTHFGSTGDLSTTVTELSEVFQAYAGEAFIHHNGGEWALGSVKNDDAYGTPIIINWGPKDYPWSRISPYVWRLLIERGKFRGNLSEVIKSN